ncbi:uncharacterized protein EAF01_003890 [Botrytis porri]|uniref:uncharacterized protein n=1 Tax=Botrytis porri TaxID=87229 RepID=UPI001901ADB0|nr:uncharacterized protein EAF01_003890 [Botrytis porri]KAF7908135.1 hypothetical protein EAF01_003890 [Botrytis porri]
MRASWLPVGCVKTGFGGMENTRSLAIITSITSIFFPPNLISGLRISCLMGAYEEGTPESIHTIPITIEEDDYFHSLEQSVDLSRPSCERQDQRMTVNLNATNEEKNTRITPELISPPLHDQN